MKKLIFIGIDDTDNENSRGTGRLSRNVAEVLSQKYHIYGVTRHQLYVHEDIPYTSHNSCSVVMVNDAQPREAFTIAKNYILSDYQEGSDPGLVVADQSQISSSIVAFGLDAKRTIIDQQRARVLARNSGILLEGLGGTEGGIIGALAGVGLAFTGNDGRFLLKGRNRECGGLQDVSELLNSGIDLIMTLDGKVLPEGVIDVEKTPRPSFINGKAVLFVQENEGNYVALKRD